MENKLSELSIFFPFWNEEKNIEEVVKKAIPVAEQVAEKWEILMIDDGSSDQTREIAKKLAAKNSHLKVISHTPNRGYGAALRAGLSNAKYKYIVFNDGDGQFDFNEVKKFIPFIESYDMVIGFRQKRNDHNLYKRLLLMRILMITDRILFRFKFKDIDCGFKMFTKKTVEEIMPLRSEGAIITTEILAKAKQRKLNIKEVGVIHYPRVHGIQTGANFPVLVRAGLETLILWYDLHYGRT
ncbi:hypothetical protein BH11PAT1_BH11PAT1_3560 [soil metagenome]